MSPPDDRRRGAKPSPATAFTRTAKAASRPYHHGDLRRALLDASLAILRQHGPEALTLRGAARAAGVSQTAPYRHFADRAALVAGVAEDGFRRLHARLLAAVTAAPAAGESARVGLQRLAVEYLRFGLEHPAEYRIMFGELDPASVPASCAAARESVFALLRGGIARLQAARLVAAGDVSAMAIACWSLMHGLVMLTLDGQVGRAADASPERLAETATNLLMFGMATGARA